MAKKWELSNWSPAARGRLAGEDVMGMNDRMHLADAIQDLVVEGLLDDDTTAFGVAQQVVHDGYDSLSDKQRAVYQSFIVPLLRKRQEELENSRRFDTSA
jgi:hypothetical protein